MPSVTFHKDLEPKFWSKTTWIQLFYILWVNLSIVNIGLTYGFSAVAIPHVEEEFHMITKPQLTWMASVLMLSAPFGCILAGYILDRVGRRVALLASKVFMTTGWVCTCFAKKPSDMIIGRSITGVGTGMLFLASRIYVTEIALPKVRGISAAFPDVAIGLGVLIQAFLGTYLSWRYLSIVGAVYSFILLILNILLPETPYFLLMRSTFEKAKESLVKFRAAGHDIDSEMAELIDFKQDNDISRLTNKQMCRAFCSLPTLKPFFIVTTFIIITELSGITVIVFWTLDIFKASECSVDPNFANIILAVIRLVSGMLLGFLLYKAPRKAMSLISGLGIAVSFITMGVLRLNHADPNMYPMVLIALYVVFASLGYHSMPMLHMSEMFPLQLRGFLGGISVSIMNFLMFGMIKSYPYIEAHIDLAFIVIMYGGFSLLGCLFIYFCIPETKGLTLQDIEEYFNNRRSTLFSERELKQLQSKSRSQIHHLQLTQKLDANAVDNSFKISEDKPGASNSGKGAGKTE